MMSSSTTALTTQLIKTGRFILSRPVYSSCYKPTLRNPETSYSCYRSTTRSPSFIYKSCMSYSSFSQNIKSSTLTMDMNSSPIERQWWRLGWINLLGINSLVRYFQKYLGLWQSPYIVFFKLSTLHFPSLPYYSNILGILTNTFSFYSSFAWINSDVISPCSDLNCKIISIMIIKW